MKEIRMSKSVRSKPKGRTSQRKLDALIVPKEQKPEFIELEHMNPQPILFTTDEYDTMQPEETIRSFCSSIRDMLSKYEEDRERLEKLEQEMQDLLHYIEMSGNKNANIGFKLYKQLAEVRRERRIRKNEIDLLQPIYSNFKDTDLLNVLGRIQGNCRAIKQQINNKSYIVRTDVLNGFIPQSPNT